MPFRKPGTLKGGWRRGDFGAMENISPLRRRMTTSSLLDSSRISAIVGWNIHILWKMVKRNFQEEVNTISMRSGVMGKGKIWMVHGE
jgi:hypothetical protein